MKSILISDFYELVKETGAPTWSALPNSIKDSFELRCVNAGIMDPNDAEGKSVLVSFKE